MITLRQIVETELRQQPELLYWLGRDLLNINALARYLRPTIQKQTGEIVGVETISMAIRRFQKMIGTDTTKTIHKPKAKNIQVQLDITTLTYDQKLPKDTVAGKDKWRFFSFVQGRAESMLAISHEDMHELSGKPAKSQTGMAALTVTLEAENGETVGAYAYITLLLAMAGIPIVEVMSVHDDITFLVADQHIDRAFQTLRSALKTPIH